MLWGVVCNMNNSQTPSNEQIEQNHIAFKQRLAYHKNMGIDHIKLRRDIMDLIDFKPSNILEVGTGKGILTIFLAEICDKIVSVDLNEEEQRIALLNLLYHKCSQSVSLICDDASTLNYPDKHFDLVVSAISFHHFENPREVIDEMARMTGKQLIITDFTEHGFEVLEKSHQQENRHHTRTNQCFDQVPQWLEEHGFIVNALSNDYQMIYCAKRNKKS